ncbi:MAG: pyruvate dehydrogenase kinase [Candidatus Sumerlaeia bacterium]|nr:pyruvate dehydrogenase kinase [Candidatus Sumerlaeia bacterium]
MITSDLPKDVLEEIAQYACLPTTSVSLRQLYEYARHADERTFIRAAQFLHREMSIRLAKKVEELEAFPNGLAKVRNVKIVRDWYVQSFKDITALPYPENAEQEQLFTDAVEKVKDRHKNQVAVMARGIREYMNREGIDTITDEAQNFLDSFFLSRIGIRVLLGHHVASHDVREGWVGIINAMTSPYEVAVEAAAAASQLCRQTFGDPPEVRFHGKLNLRLKYIPSHLHHIFFELFKNSFRATIEHNRGKGDKLPSVHVIIAGGQEDVSMKITDRGGGIPRSAMDRVWTYAYSTVPTEVSMLYSEDAVMAGLGYGLPLSRLYARYFGGDLQLISLEGFGTDAYVHLSRLGTHDELIL